MMASRMKLHVLNFLSFSRWEPSAWQRKRNLIGSPNQKSNLSDSDIPLGRSSHSLCDYDSKEVETSSNSICQDIWVKMYRICIFSPFSSLSLWQIRSVTETSWVGNTIRPDFLSWLSSSFPFSNHASWSPDSLWYGLIINGALSSLSPVLATQPRSAIVHFRLRTSRKRDVLIRALSVALVPIRAKQSSVNISNFHSNSPAFRFWKERNERLARSMFGLWGEKGLMDGRTAGRHIKGMRYVSDDNNVCLCRPVSIELFWCDVLLWTDLIRTLRNRLINFLPCES